MTRDKNKIEAVIFDWGGVCCSEGEPFASLDLQELLKMNPDQIAEQVRSVYNGYYIGNYDKNSFWNEIINHFGLELSEKINPDALSFAYLNSYAIYPEVLAMAEKLQTKYKVGLLSNLTPEMRDNILAKHELDKLFPVKVFSCDEDVSAMKPDGKPYLFICEKMKIAPDCCLFIDNSLKNIEAARNLGMQTIFFKSVAQFLEDIKFLYE